MSEGSDDKSYKTESSQNDSEQDIYCRDFLRGSCDRKFCKFKHDMKQNNSDDDNSIKFCHDFQNSSCPRPHCKFIHCSPPDEDRYRQTGEMSVHVQAEVARKYGFRGIQPICNMYQEGVCRRTNCKYRHVTQAEHEAEIVRMAQVTKDREQYENVHLGSRYIKQGYSSPRNMHFESSNDGLLRRNGSNIEEYQEYGPPEIKRRFILSSGEYIAEKCYDLNKPSNRQIFNGYITSDNHNTMFTRIDPRTIMLEEENSFLHREIVQLKKQVSDLTATNEFLLDQNATLRITTKHNANNIASVTVPAVTITNTVPQQNNAPSVQQPQVIHRTVTASVATVPVSLATVSVSTGNAVSIAGVPAVSIAQPSAQQMLAQSQQILVSTNPTPQLTLTTSSQAQLAIAQQNLANLAQQTQTALHPTSQAQQLTISSTPQQLTLANASTAQQLALVSSTQAQQLATQQLTSQAQQLALANTPHIALANAPQQLGLTTANQQLLAQQNLTTSQQMEIHRTAINTSQAIAMSNASQPMVSFPIMTQSVLQNAMSH